MYTLHSNFALRREGLADPELEEEEAGSIFVALLLVRAGIY